MFRHEMMWVTEAERMLKYATTQYENAIVDMANKIAQSNDRQCVEQSDVAYADSIHLGQLLDAQERREFLAGMGLEYLGPAVSESSSLFTHECEKCRKRYVRRSPTARYCSDECARWAPRKKKQENDGPPRYRRICEVCNVDFMGLLNQYKCKSCKVMKAPVGWYVYGWYERKELFYVGMGVDRRAFEIHKSKTNYYAECEMRRRRIGRKFRVRIIRDRLTEVGARFLESSLIDYLKPECNVARGRKGMPEGELTLDGECDLRAG